MALRVALLGCGPLGAEYADLVVASGGTVFVVHDADRGSAALISEQSGARIAPSINDAVTAVGVDAVIVCLGGRKRTEAIDAATAAGRPVFDALPPSADVIPALLAAEEAGVVAGVDLRRRHDAGVHEVVEAVRAGEVGDVRSCSIVSRDATTSAQASMIHDLDLVRHLVGSDIASVVGVRRQDAMMLVLTHANGVVTSVESGQHAPAGTEHRIELMGDTGTVSSATLAQPGTLVMTATGERRPHRPDDSLARSLGAQWASFVDSIRRAASTTSGADIANAHIVARAVAVAIVEGRTVGVAELLSAP